MGFKGGYRFKRFEGAAEPVLRECPIPGTAFVPSRCGGLSFVPMVETGDPVRAGTKILRSREDRPVFLFSPVNGTVKEITGYGVLLASDGTSHFEPVEGHTRAPWHLEREELAGLFRSTGCVFFLDGASAAIQNPDSVKTIIVNAVHNSPLNQAWEPSIAGDPFVFLNGLKILAALFPAASLTIAVNGRNAKHFGDREITDLASVKVMSDRYPQENPELLARDAAGRRLTAPEGRRDDSILVLPFLGVVQTAEILSLGRPFIDRIMPIAGPGVSRPGWYRVRTGTSFGEIKRRLCRSDDRGPWRMIEGDLFTGVGVESPSRATTPLTDGITVIREQTARELFRFMRPGFTWDSHPKVTVGDVVPLLPKRLDSGMHGGERPCVQCNYCDEVCPVGLYPFLIWKHVAAEKIEESFRLRPYDCVGCGLCDYVCPSKIPVSAAVRHAADEYLKARRADEETG